MGFVNNTHSLQPTSTLSEILDYLEAHINEGVKCPCCGQMAKVYRRKINAGMARALIEQYQKAGVDLVHTKHLWLPFSKEAAQLSWWGLIEQDGTQRDDGGRSGWWRVTPKGILYVRGIQTVPKYLYVYDGEVLRSEGPNLGIRAALGTKFRYDELMRGE